MCHHVTKNNNNNFWRHSHRAKRIVLHIYFFASLCHSARMRNVQRLEPLILDSRALLRMTAREVRSLSTGVKNG